MSKQLVILPATGAACCSPIAEASLEPEHAVDMARMFKALGDPIRLRLLSRRSRTTSRSCARPGSSKASAEARGSTTGPAAKACASSPHCSMRQPPFRRAGGSQSRVRSAASAGCRRGQFLIDTRTSSCRREGRTRAVLAGSSGRSRSRACHGPSPRAGAAADSR